MNAPIFTCWIARDLHGKQTHLFFDEPTLHRYGIWIVPLYSALHCPKHYGLRPGQKKEIRICA